MKQIEENYLLDLYGRSKQNAISKIQEDDFSWRIVKEDAISYVMTNDLKVDRINLIIMNNIVVDASRG